jgi:hypothetical protein
MKHRQSRRHQGAQTTQKKQIPSSRAFVRIKCDKFYLYISAVYLASVVEKRAYDLFVEDIEVIMDDSDRCDVI